MTRAQLRELGIEGSWDRLISAGKVKTPAVSALRREAEEDWDARGRRYGHHAFPAGRRRGGVHRSGQRRERAAVSGEWR
jgi:hypothetical protein